MLRYEVTSYEVTSFSAGKKGGQITVTVGEGANRRSFTRHLQRQGGALIGLNIDERAPELNQKYEDELRKAESNMSVAEGKLELLKKQLAKMETETPEDIIEAAMLKEMKAELETAITDARAKAMETDMAVNEAETKLAIVRRELPLMMEFSH